MVRDPKNQRSAREASVFQETAEPILPHFLAAKGHTENVDGVCDGVVPVKDADQAREHDFAKLARKFQVGEKGHFWRDAATLRENSQAADSPVDAPAEISPPNQAKLFRGRRSPDNACHKRGFRRRGARRDVLLRNLLPTWA